MKQQTIDEMLPLFKRLLFEDMDVKFASGEIDGATLLFEGGLDMDSFALTEFLTHLEQTFGIELKDDDLVPENFHDVAAVYRLINRKIKT